MFPKVNQKQSFPELEEKVLAFWKENETFKKSIESRPADNPYRFYDGPPFITGTPHYGSLLSSIIKDIIPRYQTMQGKRVERKWGWDCHGLPIEEKVQKKLGLAGSKDIEKVGIKKFIEECYTYTRETSAEWDWYIDHIGRWVDMDNAYKTMDQDYMESVISVFKNMWDKDMIYKGRRVSLYSWKLSTPISNFEVAMDDSYEEVSDPAITVMFPLTEDHEHVQVGDHLLAWTTTPWTIPCHMAIAVNPKLAYSRVSSEGQFYIIATARVETVFKGKEYEIVESFMGNDLLGLRYEAPFQYYQGKVDPDKNHRVLDADFVTDTDGTGIAHEAPEFGDVDFQMAMEKGVHISSALDNEGKYTQEISDYEGMHYQEANEVIPAVLKDMGRLFKKESINHRVAMCPRSGTPLIYKAQDSWFINIQDMKDRLIAENEGINWQPNHLKHGQFLKSMESAPDWCISRTRYWGTPMPIWLGFDADDNQVDMKVFGSKAEIFEASKNSGLINKLLFVRHRESVKNTSNVHDCSNNPEFNKLTEKGQASAKELTEMLKDEDIDMIFSSPLDRCLSTIRETAEHYGIEVVTDPRLRETDGGDEDGKTRTGDKISWDTKRGNTGESYSDIYERMKNFLTEINEKYQGKTIAIVSHGNPLWMGNKVLRDFDIGEGNKESNKYYPKKDGFSTHYVFTTTGLELDLHRPFIDDITWEENGLTYKRTPEVLDVWMDSGSMPYAQMHYPFENTQAMEASYPADFIVEYIGQVRAWFYVMHVVGVALFDKRAFTNVITTGIVMGSDGRKMSKSYGNYPDPKVTIQKYGADAIRFYMANSPLLSGGNMDFKEEGILEVIKKVILPFWNTYSFFTTYANIDGYTPSEKNLYYVRHGQTDNNKNKILNGGNDDLDLNDTGREQAKETAEAIKKSGIVFDKIISSPMLRTRSTAEIIKKELGLEVEIEIAEGIRETDFGKFKGKKEIDIQKEYNLKSRREVYEHVIGGSEGESLENFKTRVYAEIQKLQAENVGEKVLIVGHAGTYRAIEASIKNTDGIKSYFTSSRVKNAELVNLGDIKSNPLDAWVLSETHKLVADVQAGMDSYEITDATRPIVKFMDNLTNWYIRRSRKRFWKSENDGDKMEAYDTLYEVLTTLSQVTAPFMPFVSEHIYQNLTGQESVHLTYFPKSEERLINTELNESMDLCQKIISLGLALRTKQKMRVRQPLQSVSTGIDFSDYYKDIIKEELNVKEILTVDSSTIASKICKPNGRLIGPKFGKDVKDIMKAAKSGDFIELSEEKVYVCHPELDSGSLEEIKQEFTKKNSGSSPEGHNGWILEGDDFEIAYVTEGESDNIESGFGMVISMDLELTPELTLEGNARDIVRHIQEARKEAGYQVDDRISVNIVTEHEKDVSYMQAIIDSYPIEQETLSKIDMSLVKGDIHKVLELDELTIDIILKK